MVRESIFKKAAEIIQKGQIHFEIDTVNFGTSYTIKDYPFRIYPKEGFRLMEAQCNCRNGIYQPSLLCSHNVAGIVCEFLRRNPNLILLDLNNPNFTIKTAFELDHAHKEI